MRALCRTLLSRGLLLLIVLLLIIPMAILLCLPERWRYDSIYARWLKHIFYWAVLRVSFLPITFIGREHMLQEPAILVANHQSSLDIPLIGVLMNGFPHVWLATKDLMVSPILRWILPRATVLIDTSNPMNGMRSLIRAIDMIKSHQRHAIIFPEGSRYADGKVHDFYGGFVMLVKKTARPVIPISIDGAYKVYPRGSFVVHYHPIRVVIGKPLFKQTDESDEQFKERVHRWFVEHAGVRS